MCKRNKGNRPERKLTAEAKQTALDISLYTEYIAEQFTYSVYVLNTWPEKLSVGEIYYAFFILESLEGGDYDEGLVIEIEINQKMKIGIVIEIETLVEYLNLNRYF